ncbi:hypothetical protein Tco_1476636 [Tanacetum coccineum]
MYLTSSRPDLVQAICYYARYQARPTEKHLKEVKRIFKYLKGTINMGLWYPKDSGFELTTFSNADHAECLDTRKSTYGGIQFLGDKLVTWMLKKQNCTAMSSAEAEYVTLSRCCAQVMWMRTQLQDYGFHYNKIPLYCDSQSAIAISYRFKYLVRRIGIRCLTPAELKNIRVILLVLTVTMEILLEPTSNKLSVGYMVVAVSYSSEVTRSQGGENNKDKKGQRVKDLETKTKSKDNDKSSRSKIAKHEGTSLQRRRRPIPKELNDKSNLVDLMKECHILRKKRRRTTSLVTSKKRRRLLAFSPSEDPGRRLQQHELSSTMMRRREYPPLMVVFDPVAGFTVEADKLIKDLTIITKYVGDVD